MACIQLFNLKKVFNSLTVVKGSTLNIDDGEFVVFLGPSGCGKTTTLRMIAGLEDISDGEIRIDGKSVNQTPPKDRGIAMVFQNYALYPHMNVKQNMQFALNPLKLQREETDRRITEVSGVLGLSPFLDRKPAQLSGGQRQRVAMGRAMVKTPKVFLFDEPLSNLDAKLRGQVRREIAKLHKKLETTVVYVTHDQVEAMTLATKIVVMRDGNIEQVGTPKEIYERPANTFVASFVGSPPMNLLPAEIRGDKISSGSVFVPVSQGLKGKIPDGEPITLGIRPNEIQCFSEPAPDRAEGEVLVKEYLGNTLQLDIRCGQREIIAETRVDFPAEINRPVYLKFEEQNTRLFSRESGKIIHPT